MILTTSKQNASCNEEGSLRRKNATRKNTEKKSFRLQGKLEAEAHPAQMGKLKTNPLFSRPEGICRLSIV